MLRRADSRRRHQVVQLFPYLLTGGFASGGLACGLLGSCHFFTSWYCIVFCYLQFALRLSQNYVWQWRLLFFVAAEAIARSRAAFFSVGIVRVD